MDGIHKFIPLGYRCTSAGLLRKLNLKLESYPFDWLVSRLTVIQDCIETEFEQFLNIDNYNRITASTIHQQVDGKPLVICEECILYNQYYQPVENHAPTHTYQYHLALNHRDLTVKLDYDYMLRCIDRFKLLLADVNLYKISVYIHPVFFNDEVSIPDLVDDFKTFHSFLSNRTTKLSGLYFILLRNNKADNKLAQPFLECVHSTDMCFVFVLHCNCDLIDAGEIFQGECSVEVNLISQKIRERIIEDSRAFLMGGC